MGFFNFKSQAQKEKETTVKNAIAVMLADGQIDRNEMQLLGIICRRVGLSEKEFNVILQNPQSIAFTPARSLDDRMQQLIDMVAMMMIDGHIDPREMEICIHLASKLGFRPSSVAGLVHHIINELENNLETQQVSIDVAAYL